MSISIRKKYIKYNNEKNLKAQSKEANLRNEKNYKTNTFINPKFIQKEKNTESNQIFLREPKEKFHINYNLRNNTKAIQAITNINDGKNSRNNENSMRRNFSYNYMKKTDLNDINDIITIILNHEVEKIKINLLKYLINNEDINIILRNFSEIIDDLIDEYNINNNCFLDKDENKKIIENKYQIIKENIIQEYFKVNKDIYSKYFLNKNGHTNIDKILIPVTNFKKHCIKCNDIAKHKSKNILYLIPNTNYIICKQTNDIYDKNHFECFCEFDGEIYISSYISNNYKNQLQSLTHRNSLDDEKCLCHKCNHILYYNYRNKKIKCVKCNNEEIDDFNTIFYNEIFFNKLKDEINFSVIMKRKSNPNKYCSCGGICYQGKFLEKYILVCSNCKKCQFDIRNGRYKYKLYLFQKNEKDNQNKVLNKNEENKNDIKIIKINKNRNRNRQNNFKNSTLQLTSKEENIKEEEYNHNYIRRNNFQNKKIITKEIKTDINKIPKIKKPTKTKSSSIINYDNFEINKNNKKNKENINSSNISNENIKENKDKDPIKIKRDLVIKTAKLLLLNNSMTENNQNIDNYFASNFNKTLVSSRKERALKKYLLESDKETDGLIIKRKINRLLMNQIDGMYNKILLDNIDNIYKKNNKKETVNISIYNNKKSLSNNRSLNNNDKEKSLSSINIFKNNNTKKISYIKNINLQPDLKLSDYKIITLINSSPFSSIYKVQNIVTKKYLAIKKIILSSHQSLKKIKNDIEIFQVLNNGYFFESVNIIPITQYKIKKLDDISYAFYELMPLVDTDWAKKILNMNYTQENLIKILKQLIKAFSYMQKNGICHRDIKPENIFIIKDNYYIGDFDQCIEVKSLNSDLELEIKGTEVFLSPVMFDALVKNIKKVKHNVFKSDVYSFGLCFVYALTKNFLVLQKIKEIKNKEKIKQYIKDNLFDKKMKLSEDFLEFIGKIVTLDEKNRPDFIELNELIKKKYF